MIDRILRAKHWQLFVLFFAVPLVVQMIFMITMVGSILTSQGRVESLVPYIIMAIVFGLVIFLVAAAQISWYWGVGVKLVEYTSLDLELKVNKFKGAFLIPFGYFIVLILIGLIISITGTEPSPLILLFIIPMHIFTFICMLYVVYFCAKVIKSIEVNRVVSFSDCAGEFFLILFYLIGIWFIQPRINKIVEGKKIDNNLIDV